MSIKNILKILTSLILATVFHPQAHAKVSKEYIENAILQAAKKADVPVELLRAICSIESNFQVDAFVYGDGGDNNHAYGICQVLRKTAEKYVGKDKKCESDFRGQTKNFAACKLFGPKVNALAAAYYLKEQLNRYNGHMFKAAAAYNSGSLRKCSKTGWVINKKGEQVQKCKPGDLLNRYYVKRVQKVLAKNSTVTHKELAEADFKLIANKKS